MKLDEKALDEAYNVVAYRHTADKGVLAEAIRTYLTAIGETHVLVPKTALDWLDGAGPDADGHWFGDAPEDAPASRAFWWRDKFRRLSRGKYDGP